MLNRFIASFVSNSARVAATVEGLTGLGAVGMSHQYQQIRQKSKIKFCGYLEHAEFKKRDIRYKSSTRHDPKRMNWHDYQVLLEFPWSFDLYYLKSSNSSLLVLFYLFSDTELIFNKL